MERTQSQSLRRKVTWVVLSTTLAALVLSGSALLVYELLSFRAGWVQDLSTQADLIARSSAPALVFDDAKVANDNLAPLRLRPQIEAAAVYRADGRLFAQYAATPEAARQVPPRARLPGPRFTGDHLELFHAVEEGGEQLGSVYLRARHDMVGRLIDYVTILALVMIASLGLAVLISSRLQAAVIRPVLAVADVARDVIEKRNYARRVERTTDDEVGVLVDAFNDMLQEVGRRTEALERSNRDLSIEMEERHKAEQALREADRRKDRFLATLAHELRNPLAPLVNALEILDRTEGNPVLAQRARAIMQRQLGQMSRLIEDLVDVSRITTGKLELRRQAIDLLEVLRVAIEISSPAIRDRRHQLATHWPEAPVWVQGDPTRLAQVFANLLNNAAVYARQEGRIGLDVDVDGEWVAVRVSDNGIGIDPAMQEAIFEMFTQVDQSLERGRAGLGVGLTLARELVQLHGGRIGVHSAGLGRGAEFTVTLPRVEAPGARTAPAPDAATTAERGLSVLIADDNVDFALSLATMLETQGHAVQVVHDGQAALNAVLERRFDVAFFDIGMPALNGYELARRVRAQPQRQDMTLVAVTGWGQEADREQARKAGFDHHLVKPVEFDRVLAVLREHAAA
jgi:signal transduction histidine kinase/CheY-like chemotaxis protein